MNNEEFESKLNEVIGELKNLQVDPKWNTFCAEKDSGKAVNPENAVDALAMFHTVLQKLESLRYQPHWNDLRDKSRITDSTSFVDSVDVLLFGGLQEDI